MSHSIFDAGSVLSIISSSQNCIRDSDDNVSCERNHLVFSQPHDPVHAADPVCHSLSTAANGQDARIAPGEPHPKRLGVRASFIRLLTGRNHFRKTSNRRRNRIRDDSRHSQGGFKFGERVHSVRRGTPAWRAGLERGDIIVATQPRNGSRYDVIRKRRSLKTALTHANSQLAILVRGIRTGRDRWITVRFGGREDDGPRPLLKSKADE